jgi:hypothetical protein
MVSSDDREASAVADTRLALGLSRSYFRIRRVIT